MNQTNSGEGAGRNNPVILFSKVIGTLFGSIFMILGLYLGWVLADQVRPALAVYGWKETPCTIDESRVEYVAGEEAPYRWVLRYSYSAPSGALTSDQWRRDSKPEFRDRDAARHLAERYSAGSRATCYVDPAESARSVLERGIPKDAFGFLLVTAFVLLGARGIYREWRPAVRAAKTPMEIREPKSMTIPDPVLKNVWPAVLFFGAFFAIVLAIAVHGTVLPLVRRAKTLQWRQTPCVIEACYLVHEPSDSGELYRIEIRYRYEIDGESYFSSRYDFSVDNGPANAGRLSEKEAVVGRYPQGSEAICWVDPDDPNEAVLARSLPSGLIIGCIPLLFFFGFASVLVASLRYERKRQVRERQFAGEFEEIEMNAPVAVELFNKRESRFGRFVFLAAFAVGWNAFNWVFAVSIHRDWQDDNGSWFQALFMIPFVLSGAALVVVAFRSLMLLLNPRPRATLDPGRLTIGGAARLDWRLRGLAWRVKSLRLTLEGVEHATQGAGTASHSERSVFYRETLLETDHPMQIAAGNIQLAIPARTMHSFEGANNKVVWTLKVRGAIPFWIDMKDECEIEVGPLPPDSKTWSSFHAGS